MADITKTIEIVVDTDKAEKEITDLNTAIKNTEQSTKDTAKASQEYKKALAELGGSKITQFLDNMTGGLFSTVRGLAASVKGLNVFKVALASTGIGAVVVALGALWAAFRDGEGAIGGLRAAWAGFSEVVAELYDITVQLGESLAYLFSGDTQKAAEKYREAVTGIVDRLNEADQLGRLIYRQERENRFNNSARAVQIAQNDREIVQLRLIAKNKQEEFNIRRDAANKAYELEKRNIELVREQAIEERQIAETKAKTIQNSYDRGIFLNEAQAAYLKAQTVAEEKLNELQRTRNTLLTQETANIKDLTAENEKRLKVLEDIENATRRLEQQQEEFDDATFEAITASQDKFSEFGNQLENVVVPGWEEAERAATGYYETTEEGINTQKQLEQGFNDASIAAKGLIDILTGKVTGKDIFKTLLSGLGAVFSIISLVNPLASGAKNAGGIFKAIGGIFEDGGMIQGPSHSKGGVWINAEGGEGIINKRSMSIPWIRELASELNHIGGGVKFADGGIVPTQTGVEAQLSQLSGLLSKQQIVLPIPDLVSEMNKVQVIQNRATI